MNRRAAATLTTALLAAVALGAAHATDTPHAATARGAAPLRSAPLSPALGSRSLHPTGVSSTWCGAASSTDRAAQVVAGPSVHLVYVHPSDGVDRFAQFAPAMQADAEAIDAWWRGQDATRAPRFDTFAFSCGPQLDISDVKLDFDGVDLTPVERRFQLIVSDLEPLGFESGHDVYLVYFDGPDDGSGVCGEGGTDDSSNDLAFAVVFTSGCPHEPTAVIAAHELTHALGAVKPPAPHECLPPNDGHVCDSNRDLMYPFVDGSPLSSYVLDVGHDDYYGAAGVGFDVRTSRLLRHVDEPAAHLAVSITGAGTVDSDVPGVACTASCASDWDEGLTVTLSATPATGMRFVRWGGACSGTADCTPPLTGATAVSALFAPATYRLVVGVRGRGSVFTSVAASLCQRLCRLPVTSYRSVSLHAVAAGGWRFTHWTGTCRGSRPLCTLPMSANSAATAVFAKKPKRQPAA